MKTLNKQATFDQDSSAFFENERNIMASGSSPWLTALEYAFQDQENLYLVMEFHPGGDLLSLLTRQESQTVCYIFIFGFISLNLTSSANYTVISTGS